MDTVSKINDSLNRVFSVTAGILHTEWVVREVRCDFVTHNTELQRVTSVYIQVVLM